MGRCGNLPGRLLRALACLALLSAASAFAADNEQLDSCLLDCQRQVDSCTNQCIPSNPFCAKGCNATDRSCQFDCNTRFFQPMDAALPQKAPEHHAAPQLGGGKAVKAVLGIFAVAFALSLFSGKRKEGDESRLGGAFSSGLTAAMGLGALIFAYSWFSTQARIGAGSAVWPHTQGRMLEAYVLEKANEGRDADRWTHDYRVSVRYSYTVDGKSYTGWRLQASSKSLYRYRSDAVKALAPFPTQGAVTVYYNPDDPSESVLIPGTSR